MDISIILRTKNEAQWLQATLDRIRAQAYPSSPEVVLVDSGSTDGTLRIAQSQALRLIQIPPEKFSYGRALNIGIGAASGDVAVVLSAHAFPCGELWLKQLVQHFGDPNVAGVYGRQLPHAEAWPYVKRDYYEFYGSELRVQSDANLIADHCFSNAASALRKSLWEKHRFDETLPYCEDWEWARAMLRFGLKIVYEPNAAVYHSHNERFIDVYRRSYKEASARRRLYGQQSALAVSWFKTWRNAVLADMRFIRERGYHRKWCFWSVLYRFCWSCGRSLPAVRG